MTVSRPKDSKEVPELYYSPVGFAARSSGVVIASFVEAYGTYSFDKYKNIRIRNPQKLPSFFAPGSTYKISPAFVDHFKINIIGKDYASSKSFGQSFMLAYRGSSAYFVYKLFNRSLKNGFHPMLMEGLMSTPQHDYLAREANPSLAKLAASTIAGGMLGLAEVPINPVDRWKLLCQTRNVTMSAALKIMQEEGLKAQYSGWKETASRNLTGSSILFFTKYLTYQVLGLQDHNKPTAYQSLLSNMSGYFLMIVGSHPFDVLKVRKQMEERIKPKPGPGLLPYKPLSVEPEIKKGMRHTLFAITKNEGFAALSAGLLPKLIGSGFKGSLIMSMCDMLIKEINEYLTKHDEVVHARPRPRF